MHASELVIGGDYEFFARPEWADLAASYRLEFRELISMDPTIMYSAATAGEVDVISAFSTDGRIAAFDLVVLEDSRGAFPPYDAIVLTSPAADNEGRNSRLREALALLDGTINAERMRNANKRVDLDGGTIREAAQTLYASPGEPQ